MPATGINWRWPVYTLYERLAGRKTLRYLGFLQEMQWKAEEEVLAFQWRELRRLLHHAWETVPFHRRRFQALGLGADDIRTPEDYRRLPLMERRDFLDHHAELQSTRADGRRVLDKLEGSGGSTGVPVRYRYDRDSYEWRQAAHLRGDIWAGGPLGRRELHLWGQHLKPDSRLRSLKKRVHQYLLNQQFVDCFDLSPELLDRCAAQYRRARPELVVGYANALYLFARHAEERGLSLPPPRAVIATAEKLGGHARATVERVLGAPVFDRYGCQEVRLIGMECEEHRGLHLTADNLYVEVLQDGRPAEPGEAGEVVITDLHNYTMPFLRYRVGDVAVASDRRCPCGRGLPLIEEVRGRTIEVVRTPDGRRLTGLLLESVMEEFLWVTEYQVEQRALDRVDVRVRPGRGYQASLLPALEAGLRERLGPRVELRLEIVESIARTRSGKLRPIISHLPLEPDAADRTSGARTASPTEEPCLW